VSGRLYLLLPLASSIIYVLSALLVRQAADMGVGVWRTTFVNNALSAALFVPLLLLGGPGQPLHAVWQPAVLALLLITGQTLGFLALTRGDVTVATPAMGLKTVMVAMMTVLILAVQPSTRLWIAASLSSGAIALLSLGPAARHRRVGLSIAAGAAAAMVFAVFDVLVQKWSPAWGAGRLIPLVMTLGAFFSVAFVPFFREPLRAIPRAAWRPLLSGAFCGSIQGILLITTIAIFGDATSVNIVYATRSLWIVIAVWSVGHWFDNTERLLGMRVLGWRMGGALLMTAAVLMAVL
jgi:drug/metabolite transporter (DMT)-like permease